MLFDNPPEEWNITTLGEVCSQGGGGIQTGPFGSQLHASDYVDEGIPSIMPANIGDNRISEEGIARITTEDADRLSKYLVQDGDIVYSRRGDVEKCALVRKHEDGWLCGTGCLRVRPGNGVVDPLFCSYVLSHPESREWISRHAVGATMPNLNTQILSEVPFLLPALPEQKAIAHILGTLDDKIELNRKSNETLEGIAKALFKSWFVDFDPVRAKAEGRLTGLSDEICELFPNSFEESELGEIPSRWKVSTLGEENEIVMGQSPPGHTYNEEGIGLPFYQGRSDFGFRHPGERVYCSEPSRLAAEGSTLMSVRAPVGSINMASKTCCVGRGVASIKSEQGNHAYTYYLMDSIQDLFETYNSEGTVFGAINKKDLSAIEVVRTSKDLEQEFERFASQIDHRISLSLAESASLTALRDALLPRLISGELRVPDAEKMLEEVGI